MWPGKRVDVPREEARERFLDYVLGSQGVDNGFVRDVLQCLHTVLQMFSLSHFKRVKTPQAEDALCPLIETWTLENMRVRHHLGRWPVASSKDPRNGEGGNQFFLYIRSRCMSAA